MKEYDVPRRDGTYPLAEIREKFSKFGIVVLKEFLASDTKDDVRALLELKLSDARNKDNVLKLPIYPEAEFLLGDILAIRELEKYEYIFFRRELLDVIRELLDSKELIYCGDSSVQFGEAARGFHKDNVDRYDGTKDDWADDYGLIRCAFYCQDHTTHSGGLKVRLSSHKIATHKKGKIVDVSSKYGDMVLWNMRLTHSGNNRKLRFLGKIALHPRLEMICPALLAAPEQTRRISAFCAFGKPGSHTERYIANFNVREADYKAYFERARKPRETLALLSKYGISFKQPNDYYGERD